MDVTIRDVLTLPELRECRLLCEEVTCSQAVESVTIMDNPDILDWMSAHKILLSNGSSLVDLDEQGWKAFFSGLVNKRASALFIKLDYYIKDIPGEALAHAAALDLPVVVVPNGYSWARLSAPIQRLVIERRFYFLSESLDLLNRLNRAMARGCSIDDICRIAADDMHSEVAVFTSDGWDCLGKTDAAFWDEVAAVLKRPGARIALHPQADMPKGCCVSTPKGRVLLSKLSGGSGKHYSAYRAHDESDAVEQLDAFKIEQVNAALLLSIRKEEELGLIESHYYADFLSELLDGSLSSEDEIAARAKRLGRTVRDEYQLILGQGGALVSPDALSSLARACRQHVDPAVRDVLLCTRGRWLVLFFPAGSVENRSALEQVCALAQKRTEGLVERFGISRPYPVANMRRALDEAAFASSAHRLTELSVVYYEDLGILRLFESSAQSLDASFMSDYYERVMGALVRHDEEAKSNLVDTLKAYFANDGSVPRTASALFVHENTLRMRLKRIEAVSGLSLKTTAGFLALCIGSIIDDFVRPSR